VLGARLEEGGSAVSLRVEDGGEAVPRVLELLRAQDVDARGAALAQPTLDDVFLEVADRRLAEAA
jgi:hypothetical protein